MELIDRYLQAVKFWLPKQQKQDIIAELWEDIHAEVEAREAVLGRALNEGEVAELLKQRGRPVLVANRYLPQQFLIGPVLFPIYVFVLKVVALCYLVPWVLVWLGMMIYSPGYRAAQGAHSWLSAVGSLWGSFWLTATVTVGAVTIAFAILERTQAKRDFLEKWDPRKLPPVRDPNRIRLFDSVVELVVNLFVIGWWAQNMPSHGAFQLSAVHIIFAPAWSYFFWGVLVISLVNTSLAVVNLMRPYATRVRASIRFVSDSAGSALFCWLLKASVLTRIEIANAGTGKALDFTNALNWWTDKLFPAALIVCVVIAVFNAFKIMRVKPGRARPASQATIVAALLLIMVGTGLRLLPERAAGRAAVVPALDAAIQR